jgi:hypothetical protein
MERGDEFIKRLMNENGIAARCGRPPSDHKVRTANATFSVKTANLLGIYLTPRDTENAEFWSGSETLYQTKNGLLFLEVVSDWGGAPGGYLLAGGQVAAGYCIIPVSKDEAIEWAEHRGELADIAEHLGLPAEDGVSV